MPASHSRCLPCVIIFRSVSFQISHLYHHHVWIWCLRQCGVSAFTFSSFESMAGRLWQLGFDSYSQIRTSCEHQPPCSQVWDLYSLKRVSTLQRVRTIVFKLHTAMIRRSTRIRAHTFKFRLHIVTRPRTAKLESHIIIIRVYTRLRVHTAKFRLHTGTELHLVKIELRLSIKFPTSAKFQRPSPNFTSRPSLIQSGSSFVSCCPCCHWCSRCSRCSRAAVKWWLYLELR